MRQYQYNHDVTVTGNTTHTNGSDGIVIADQRTQRDANMPVHVLLNETHNNGRHGISLYTGRQAEGVHNSVHDNAQHGVAVNNTTTAYVNFNNLYNNATAGAGYYALANSGGAPVDALGAPAEELSSPQAIARSRTAKPARLRNPGRLSMTGEV